MRNLTPHARRTARVFHFRVFQFLVLTILATAMATAPFRLAAQQTLPAGGEKASSSESTAESKAGPSEEEQANAFRLDGPLVKASAKALHLDTETTARLFELINFAIIGLAIGIPLLRFLPSYLRKRGDKVRADIESARKVTEDANTRLSAVEAKLSKMDEEIARFRDEVEREGLQDEARIKATLAEESARIVVAAEQEIGMAATQARRELRHFAADLAIEQASKTMVLTPETDRALIAEFVIDMSKNGAGKGGQN